MSKEISDNNRKTLSLKREGEEVAPKAEERLHKVLAQAGLGSRRALEERIAQGADVILEIDFQGALQVKQAFSNAVLVFILPPSWEELRSRLERRGEDSAETIELRLKNAAIEMAQVDKFDFVIINELFESALFDLKAVVHAQRLKYAAQRRARADTFKSLNIT